MKAGRRLVFSVFCGVNFCSLVRLGAADESAECRALAQAIAAAGRGEDFQSEWVESFDRVVTLKDRVTEGPDFLCAGPVHIGASGIKLRGEGDVLIKLADHANAPLVIVGPLKSMGAETYWAMSETERRAFRVRQVHIDNIRLDGNRLNQDHECWTSPQCDDPTQPLAAIRNNGITVRYSEYVTLTRIKVTSTISGGFVAERFSNNLYVDGYESNDNFFDGFTAYQTYNSVFKNLDLNKNLAAGISLDLDVRGNTFLNVSIKDTGDVGVFARAIHQNYFKNMTIENPGNHGIFLARHPDQSQHDVPGQIPWDTVTYNVFEDLTVRGSRRGVGIRVNDAECIGNHLTRYLFENNAHGDVSLAREGILEIDPQLPL